jgi:transcriptional regulator with XRE-family HTH domain
VSDGENEDWSAVAQAISARLEETRMTQMDVASSAKVSLTTLRELQHNQNSRRRRPQTLSAVSEALGWPPAYLGQVLRGESTAAHTDEASDPVLAALKALEEEVAALRDRVGRLEQQQAAEDA